MCRDVGLRSLEYDVVAFRAAPPADLAVRLTRGSALESRVDQAVICDSSMNAVYGGFSQRRITTKATLSSTHARISHRAKRESRPSHELLRATGYLSVRRTLFMVTVSTGTSSKPCLRPVATAAILSITSIPAVTLANTA